MILTVVENVRGMFNKDKMATTNWRYSPVGTTSLSSTGIETAVLTGVSTESSFRETTGGVSTAISSSHITLMVTVAVSDTIPFSSATPSMSATVYSNESTPQKPSFGVYSTPFSLGTFVPC